MVGEKSAADWVLIWVTDPVYTELQTYSILAANQSTIDRFFSHATNPVAQIFRYVHEGEREEESFRSRSDFSRVQKKIVGFWERMAIVGIYVYLRAAIIASAFGNRVNSATD